MVKIKENEKEKKFQSLSKIFNLINTVKVISTVLQEYEKQ